MSIRIVVADDHPMFRLGVVAALESADDVEVVAEAADGAQLLAMVTEHSPDVVLTDLSMPGVDGAAATAWLRAHHPAVAVLVLTMHDDDESLVTALRAGASGYLLKEATGAEIVRAVHAVAQGQGIYGQAVARRMADFFTAAQSDFEADVFPQLTPRERQVLDLMAAGAGNHEIARRLVLSEKTVRNNVSAILPKLSVADRSHAIVRAREAGLGR